MVAMEFAVDLRGDTFAGTPGLVVVRYLVSRVATRGLGRLPGERQLAVHDASCAFLQAPMDEEIYIKFPSYMVSPEWAARLLTAMYGTRRAAFLWGEKVFTDLCTQCGFVRGKGTGNLYHHLWARFTATTS